MKFLLFLRLFSLQRTVFFLIFGIMTLMIPFTAGVANSFEPNPTVMNPLSRRMPTEMRGPFITLPDGTIVTLQNGDFYRSGDGGTTWESHPVLDKERFTESESQTFLRTREGRLIYAFLNGKEQKDGKEPWGKGSVEDWVLPTYVTTSTDDGATWSEPILLQRILCGAIRCMIQLKSGRIVLVGQSVQDWSHVTLTYVSDDQGKTWQKSDLIQLGGKGDHDGAMEATAVERHDGSVYMLIRTTRGTFYESVSTDGCLTWSEPVSSGIRNNYCCGTLSRLSDGRISLMWNMNPYFPAYGYRTPYLSNGGEVDQSRQFLVMAFSRDECQTWTDPIVIASNPPRPGDPFWKSRVSYPQLSEVRSGEYWIATMQGDLRMVLTDQEIEQLTEDSKKTADATKKIVFIGDSATAVSRAGGTVVYSDLVGEALKTAGGGEQVINAGRPGDTVLTVANRFDFDILLCRPNVLVIQLGINDSILSVGENGADPVPRVPLNQFTKTIKSWIAEAKTRGIRVILLTTNPIHWSEKSLADYGKPPYNSDDPNSFTNMALRTYNEAVRQIAVEESVELVDIFAEYDRIQKEEGEAAVRKLLAPDMMNPNNDGHRLVFEKLWPLFEK